MHLKVECFPLYSSIHDCDGVYEVYLASSRILQVPLGFSQTCLQNKQKKWYDENASFNTVMPVQDHRRQKGKTLRRVNILRVGTRRKGHKQGCLCLLHPRWRSQPYEFTAPLVWLWLSSLQASHPSPWLPAYVEACSGHLQQYWKAHYLTGTWH